MSCYNRRKRLARTRQAREFTAYVLCGLVCALACATFFSLGVTVFAAEPIFSLTGLACLGGMTLAALAALWFFIFAPRAAHDAYCDVLYSRS